MLTDFGTFGLDSKEEDPANPSSIWKKNCPCNFNFPQILHHKIDLSHSTWPFIQ